MTNNRTATFVFGLALLMACAANAAAHPFHVSIAEGEWNAETKRLEVSLRVSPEDLEAALTKQAKERVRLEEMENVDEQIAAYLQEHFCFRKNADEEPLKLKWTGKEITTKAAWLYFELEAPDGVDGLELTNNILVDEEETQINTVVLRQGKQKTTLRFDKKRTEETVTFEGEKVESK
jgi:hypothetical protein